MSSYGKPPWAHRPQHDWKLLEIKGGVQQNIYTLNAPCVVFGRAADQVDIPLQHESASRQHARIAFDKSGTPWLRDLQSTHGVTVNKKRVPAAAIGREESNSTKAGARGVVLFPGDLLTFGASTRIYCMEGPSEFSRGAIKKFKNPVASASALKHRAGDTTFQCGTPTVSQETSLCEEIDTTTKEVTDENVPDENRKEWEKVKALRYKLQNIQSECERIRSKERNGELSSGQQRQLERNGERITELKIQLQEKEQELTRKVFPGRINKGNRLAGVEQSDHVDDDDDDGDFYDRTKSNGESRLQLSEDGETESSLVAKWEALHEERNTVLFKLGRSKDNMILLEQRAVFLNSMGDEDSFFAQNELDLAKESVENLESKKSCIDSKLRENAKLLTVVNPALKPDVESGTLRDALPTRSTDNVHPEKGIPNLADKTSQAEDRCVDDVIVPAPMHIATCPSATGELEMPLSNKKRESSMSFAMPPPPPMESKRMKTTKRTAHAPMATLAVLSSMQSTKVSSEAPAGMKDNVQATISTISSNEKNDAWQAPPDQDGSGITKLNAKFAGRY